MKHVISEQIFNLNSIWVVEIMKLTIIIHRTYMAASGLNPKYRSEVGVDENCVCDIVEFAIAMKHKLQEVNMDAFNTFQLRVGISSGPLISGVIGARKPIFDIWGNTGRNINTQIPLSCSKAN